MTCVSLIEVLDDIKKKGVDAYKIRKVHEEYERLVTYTNDYITKYDIATLVVHYHFPQKDEVHESVSSLLGIYVDTMDRVPAEDKKIFIDRIVDYLDHK